MLSDNELNAVLRGVANVINDRLKAIPAPLKGDPGEPGQNAEVTDDQIEKAVTDYLTLNPIPTPSDGKSVAVEDVLPILQAELTKAVDAIPRPKDGQPGKDADQQEVATIVIQGLKADEDLLAGFLKRIESDVRSEISKIPIPKDGDAGQPGRNAYDVAVSLGFEGTVHDWMESLRGEKGADGKSVTAEDVIPALTLEFRKAVEVIPLPRDGVDGKSVTVEELRTMFEAEQAKWALEFERRAFDLFQKAIDRIPVPKDGRDGIDGLGFDDLEVIHDSERQITLKFSRGDQIKAFPLTVPVLLDRGVYKSGQSYQRGDCTSFGGSIWIAQRDTEAKPETDDSWRLSVKRGRDGKDGIKGDKGDPGPRGKGT